MKKIHLLLIIITLFIPTIVSAQAEGVSIKSIELVEKSTGTTELASPRYEGLEVFFRVKFENLHDKAKYKIVIENKSDNKYEITTTNTFDGRDYMTYTYSFGEEGNIVNPKSSKTMYIEVSYSYEVPDNKYVNGKYSDENVMNILVDMDSSPTTPTTPTTPTEQDPDPTDPEPTTTEDPKPTSETPKEEKEIDNPTTGASLPWIIIISGLVIGLGIYLATQKKLPLKKISGFIIAIGVSLPMIASAIEQLYVKVNVYVEIEKQQVTMKAFTTTCTAGVEFQFEEGMTWLEFINSDYNTYFNKDEYYDPDTGEETIKIALSSGSYYFVPRNDYIEEKEYYCEEEYVNPSNECCHDFGDLGVICSEDVCYMNEPDADYCCTLTSNSYTCDYECLFGGE